MRQAPRIKFFARSFDLRLYKLSKALYGDLGYDCVRLVDQSADGYFYSMLSDEDCDIAVNVDEDAFLIDTQALEDMIDLLVKEGYANIGYSDGDEATTHRDKVVTNPFFNIFNLSLIRTKFRRELIRPVNFSDREPYYPFFYWLASEFKTLYLPCRRHADGVSTIGLVPDGRPLCLHSWFSRFYSMPGWVVRLVEPSQGNQKLRIDALIGEAYALRGKERPRFGVVDKFGFVLNKIARWAVKVPQRMSRWPFKIRRALSRCR